MKYIVCKLLFLLALPIFSLEPDQLYLRINNDESSLEVASKKFINADGVTVELIATFHQALPEYYQEVDRRVADKVVLYELHGGPLESTKKVRERVASLGEVYAERWFKLSPRGARPNALGMVNQDLSYANCLELIHADAVDEPSSDDHDPFSNKSDDELRKLIDNLAHRALANYEVPWESDNEINEKLDIYRDRKASVKTKYDESIFLRNYVKEMLITTNQAKSSNYEGLSDKEIEFINYQILFRNQILFGAMRDLWTREVVPKQIAIPYGTGHMPFAEEFLLENGFSHVEGSTTWLLVAKLEKELIDTEPELRKTYISADKLTEVHLIGSIVKANFSDEDRSFLYNLTTTKYRDELALRGTAEGINITLLKEHPFEIIYSPKHIPFVERYLLKTGFEKTGEVPIFREERSEEWSFAYKFPPEFWAGFGISDQVIEPTQPVINQLDPHGDIDGAI